MNIIKKVTSKMLPIFIIFLFILFIGFTAFNKLEELFFREVFFYCKSLLSTLYLEVSGKVFLFSVSFFLIMVFFKLFRIIFLYMKICRIQNRELKSSRHIYKINKTEFYKEHSDLIKVFKESKPVAFCIGILHPKIYLSTYLIKIMSIEELEVILKHELSHIKNKDNIKTLLFFLLSTFLPFIPVISDLYENFRVKSEVEADKESIDCEKCRDRLVNVMKKLIKYDYNYDALPVPSLGNSLNIIEQRIKSLTNKNYKVQTFKFKTLNVFISLTAVIFLIFLFSFSSNTHIYANSDTGTMICPKDDSSCIAWCEGNKKERNTADEKINSSYSSKQNNLFSVNPLSQ